MLSGMKNRLLALHRDEEGADMVEYILVVAAIALPLLGMIIWFWRDIAGWAKGLWEDIKGGSGGTEPPDI